MRNVTLAAEILMEQWRQKYYIGPNDVQDNSQLDMNELVKGIETDFSLAEN